MPLETVVRPVLAILKRTREFVPISGLVEQVGGSVPTEIRRGASRGDYRHAASQTKEGNLPI
ncbi:MAG TPA: hypothetical protein VKK79_08880 [Candidatus Lokiarchaeia archaeon]|nr:hypothetical protein [Candidatus Lokiarchaeia archaeon]